MMMMPMRGRGHASLAPWVSCSGGSNFHEPPSLSSAPLADGALLANWKRIHTADDEMAFQGPHPVSRVREA